jgi:hypothetical protein
MMALLACVAAAGCGSAARHHGRPAPPASRTPVAGTPISTAGAGYTWLVGTQGAQPSVASENRFPGTTAWRLPGPAADVGGLAYGNVHGYVAREAVRVGETETIYVDAPGARTVRIRIFRMGWYRGLGGREVLVSRPLRVGAQPPCPHDYETGLTECAWHPTLSFPIPSALPTGVYIAKLTTHTGASDCLFVVLAGRPQPLLAQLPTSTYEAYNAWGGDSLYPGGADRVGITGTTQGVEVSYERPYDSVTGAGQFFARDVAMVRFLERYGYPVSYTTSESVNEDPGQLEGHRALIDFGHSEYWSQKQMAAFSNALRRGTSLLFFSSDTLAWRVRYVRASRAAGQPGAPDRTIVAYKEFAALDPNHKYPTGPVPDGGASLTGSAYQGCITPRLAQPGPPTYRYYSWVPSIVLRPQWLFADTGITSSTLIPGIVGYELDMRTPASPPGTEVLGAGAAPCMAGAARDAVTTAHESVAQTTLYTAASGALVFSSGTLGWELGLEPVPSASPDAPAAPNPYLVRLTRNLLARVLAGR